MRYIGENLVFSENAGSKARTDIECILHKNYNCLFDINAIPTSPNKFKNFLLKIKYFMHKDNIKTILNLKKKIYDDVILQYPFYFNRIHNHLLKQFVKTNHVVIFVHDIDSLRHFGNVLLEDEIDLLNHAKLVVVHNHFMKDILRSKGMTTKVLELGLFDYILNQKPSNTSNRIHFGKEIVFAGNLQKSGFLPLLANLDECLSWNLYGNGIPEVLKKKKNIVWKGSFGPDEIPFKLEGSFGLVWDGNSIDECKGFMGDYLRYNNPHKLSLYIASGLPVVTWRQAAIAQFIQKYNIGFVVDNITQIPQILDKMDKNLYLTYKTNIQKLQDDVIQGNFTNTVLKHLNLAYHEGVI